MSEPSGAVSNPIKPVGDWFGQPRGLTILFLTEMWEKFSFFGMRALLVYYMTKQLMIGQAQASLIYGFYTAFVYLTPILGGYISDRWLGRRRAVILGGSIMAAGHFLMAFEPAFYVALATIAVGNGLFLPSLPSQVRGLYAKGDPRGGSAYNIYYVGINLGAFLAPLVCGTLGELYGWHWGFGAAGVGMVAGLVVFMLGRPYLPPDERPATRPLAGAPDASGDGLAARALLLLAGVGVSVVVFRTAYEQTGNTIALWADTGIDRSVGGGLSIPMTWFQSFNPLLVFLMTPLLVAWWSGQARKGREPRPVSKMSIGAALVSLSFLALAGVALAADGVAVSWLWLAAFFVVLTLGELFILPVGLGLFAGSAPVRLAATMVAAWFMASFFGNLLAGWLGTLWSSLSPAAFFALMAGVSALSAVALLSLSFATRRNPTTPSSDGAGREPSA